MFKVSFACFLAILISQNAFAQTDSLKKSDSINATILKDYNNRLILIERQRKIDSIKKAELEIQLQSLKTTDNLKKEELQKQLQELGNQEAKRIAAKKNQINSLRKSAKSFPVKGFLSDTLFFIYSRLGSFSAYERAEAISNRIEKLADNYNFVLDSLKISEAETTFDIVYGEKIIMSISESDAIWNNLSKSELAEEYHKILGNAVLKYKSETSFKTLAKSIGLALLVVIIFGFIIFYLNKLFKWTQSKIEFQENKRIKGITIKNYTLFDAKRQVNAFLSVNSILKWFLILLSTYIALPILFGIFPWTKNFAETLFGYILNPLKKIAGGLWNYLPNLITILVIVVVFSYVLKGINFLKSEIEKGNLTIPGFYPDWANPTYQIVRVIVFAFMIVVIFPYLPGSDSPVFQGVSVFLGFLFTFGSAGSLSNVIAGLVLTYMRLFKIGDRVKIGEVVGDVIEKSLLVTRIRTTKNEIISIPNSTVMSSHTINYSSDTVDKGLILHTTVTIGYDVPWKNIHQALLNAADRTELLQKEPNPFILQTSLDDFYVSYQLNAYTKEANKQATIYSQLHANIQDCCNEAGIEILSPHYRAARDGNTTTIPQNYLPTDYKAPNFNVNVNKS
ncbi:MAG: transmembrane ion channel [Bacteroidetes bacterium HGW-Bacteroidetes-13]|nr:MAG: transmembrane ion channel [Bacteroidetes bacterium HGW-Bacteroidetes-13]